jgi:curli biogenesis system outer membrane secretion channel CsgG
MRRALVVLLSLCCFAYADGKLRVAVYMAGEEPAEVQGVHKVLGGELAKAINRSDRYSAVDRTEAILSQLTKEHKFQRSGAVNDDQIKALGQQFGAQYLCIVEISALQGSGYYLDMRLVDVVTAELVNTATASSDFKDNAEMIRVAQQTARELVDTENFKKDIKRETAKKRTFLLTGLTLDVAGAGMLVYGLYENNVADGLIKDKKFKDAERPVRNRNLAYIAGGILILSGVSVHIFF